MSQFIIRRLLISVPVLLGITFIAFAALSLAPGDPLLARLDPSVLAQQSPEWIEEKRRELGLDQPVPVRYLRWLEGLLRGDLGFSIVTRRSISEELAVRLPVTLQLMGTALLIGLFLGIPFGVISAIKQYSKLDYVLTGFTMTMISTPTFFLGLLAIYVFGVYLRVLPTSGMATLGGVPSLADSLSHLVLPAGILGLANAAQLMRYTRASMLEVLRREYVVTARAKGLADPAVFLRHALRNALVPIISILGLLLPELVVGAIVTEQIFAWPGMGRLMVNAILSRDFPVVQGTAIIYLISFITVNFLVDVAYTIIDEKIGARLN